MTNQLRAHLQNVFPGAVGLFADLDSPISLAFLARFDCQDRADWLSVKRLSGWLASVGYSGGVHPAQLHSRLVAAPRGATGAYGAVQAHITAALLAVLCTLTDQIKALTVQISQQLAEHADQQIFTSLPPQRNGQGRPAAGRNRGLPRTLPHPRLADLLSRRGTIHPTIRQKPRCRFPLGLRQTAPRRRLRLRRRQPPGQPLGRRPLPARPRPRPRPPHAVRILARAWLFVIWHCWQDNTAYDPNRHRALQHLLNQDHPTAA